VTRLRSQTVAALLLVSVAIFLTKAGVPQGRMTSGVFSTSMVFPGTTRDYRVYVPAQYEAGTPACLMVFQDGPAYWKPDGAFRVPVVFDNLIHRKEMPVTIAVFVTPGTVPPTKPGAKARSNRSFEYDSLGDRYAKFLVDELLPVALAGLEVSPDPRRRAICGISSGGICAFTAAWERPDQFGKVLSHIGSFTNIRGGWAYPGLIRKTKPAPKPLKIWFQDGRDDLDNLHGHWPLANEDLAAALRFAGYEHRFVMTEGGHSGGPGGELLPAAIRWLWADQGAGGAESAAVAETNPRRPGTEPHPDAVEHDGVPRGTVEQLPAWESKVFPGTTRNWAIYVPAQYRRESPAALMIFQDGHTYRDGKGRWRVPVVFDNLIARGAMPPTIAVFLDPGHDASKQGNASPASPWKNSNRSLEYDSLGDRYARFLLEEIIPELEKRYAISPDPAMRAICGMSSGGICAFTAAWERPDRFGKVLSHIGSFTNIRGGDAYPSLIRKTEPKPLRVCLEDCGGDLDNQFGNWPLANRQMAAALAHMGYDVRFDYADGFAHDASHGGPLFPEALIWLWRPAAPATPYEPPLKLEGDMPLRRLLVAGGPWEVVADGLGFADAPCADAEGNFYFCDMKAPGVHRISASNGSRRVIAAEAVSGLEFGPDGLLYGCQGSKRRVIAIDPQSGTVKEVATGVSPNDLAVTADGFLYVTETKERQVTRVNLKTGEVAVVDSGLDGPNGIVLTSDGGTLAVSEYQGSHGWTYRVNPDGGLDAKMPTMTLRLPIDRAADSKPHEPPPYEAASKGDGMAVDAAGRFYVTSAVGVQVFDPTSRLCGVLASPNPAKPLTSCVLAGAGHEYLHVTNGDTVYRRRLKID
jgi:enterochelin esterase-like enzyme/sugar lactone lactonase YvrE